MRGSLWNRVLKKVNALMGKEREARNEDKNRRDGKPGDGGIGDTKTKRSGQ